MVNHGQNIMVIFSQSWSSLMVDPVILLAMVIDRPSQIQDIYIYIYYHCNHSDTSITKSY